MHSVSSKVFSKRWWGHCSDNIMRTSLIYITCESRHEQFMSTRCIKDMTHIFEHSLFSDTQVFFHHPIRSLRKCWTIVYRVVVDLQGPDESNSSESRASGNFIIAFMRGLIDANAPHRLGQHIEIQANPGLLCSAASPKVAVSNPLPLQSGPQHGLTSP